MHKFPEIAARLKRAQGHLAGVVEMMEAGRPCMDLTHAKKELIKDHINHCMEETSESLSREVKNLIDEFEGVTKYL